MLWTLFSMARLRRVRLSTSSRAVRLGGCMHGRTCSTKLMMIQIQCGSHCCIVSVVYVKVKVNGNVCDGESKKDKWPVALAFDASCDVADSRNRLDMINKVDRTSLLPSSHRRCSTTLQTQTCITTTTPWQGHRRRVHRQRARERLKRKHNQFDHHNRPSSCSPASNRRPSRSR